MPFIHQKLWKNFVQNLLHLDISIALSKRFCKLVVIYAVIEFCTKYLTSELKCIKVKDTANWLLFMQIPICMHNLMILKCQQCIKTIIYALKSLHLKCKVIAFCILEMLCSKENWNLQQSKDCMTVVCLTCKLTAFWIL